MAKRAGGVVAAGLGLAPPPVLLAFVAGEDADHGEGASVDRDGASEESGVRAVFVGPKFRDLRVAEDDDPRPALEVEVGEETSGGHLVLRDGEIVGPRAGHPAR